MRKKFLQLGFESAGVLSAPVGGGAKPLAGADAGTPGRTSLHFGSANDPLFSVKSPAAIPLVCGRAQAGSAGIRRKADFNLVPACQNRRRSGDAPQHRS